MGLIQGYKAPTAANKYADDIAELIAAGEGAAWGIEVELPAVVGDGSEVDNAVQAEVRAFQRAALDAGKSARVMEKTVGEKTATVVFVLSDKRERKSATVDAADAPASAEAPAATK